MLTALFASGTHPARHVVELAHERNIIIRLTVAILPSAPKSVLRWPM